MSLFLCQILYNSPNTSTEEHLNDENLFLMRQKKGLKSNNISNKAEKPNINKEFYFYFLFQTKTMEL